ncbi:MAG: FtsW/RodA/SpoVE family cell cycle protein [Phototrophicaceae bacterium]
MAENAPELIDLDSPVPPLVRGERPVVSRERVAVRVERQNALVRFLAGIDVYMLVVVGILLSVSLMMVYSTTFDWGYRRFDSRAYFLIRHAQNMLIGFVAMVFFTLVDYRIWRRLAFWILLAVMGALVAVLLFGDDEFGARRGLIGGRFQPGEAAQLATIIYMAAWLSSSTTRVRSIAYGLIPFAAMVGLISGLVLLQPDLSTAAIIFVTAGMMFFLAGASWTHLVTAALGITAAGFVVIQQLSYAQDRIASYFQGIQDLTQTNYHVQQAILAFIKGGWFGVGLGAGRQKFGYLPAPHTDSIFASIGEELGILGAGFILLLYALFVLRGFMIARRSQDNFGALLAVGVTVWLVAQALLNIAVMTAVLPSTGVPLPLISYGGSSMTSLLAGIGLMLSVGRVAARQQPQEQRRTDSARDDRSGRDGRPRLSRVGSR